MFDLDLGGAGAPFALKQISPVLFNGSRSRGEGLSYFIEFGDRQFATAATVVHPMQKEGSYVARLAVVDRFGRSDTESVRLEAKTLVSQGPYNWWEGAVYAGITVQTQGIIEFTTQDGTSVSGVLHRTWTRERANFTGTVTSDGEVRLQLAGSQATLTGRMTLGPFVAYQRMHLTYHGGVYDGQTFDSYWRDGY